MDDELVDDFVLDVDSCKEDNYDCRCCTRNCNECECWTRPQQDTLFSLDDFK